MSLQNLERSEPKVIKYFPFEFGDGFQTRYLKLDQASKWSQLI